MPRALTNLVLLGGLVRGGTAVAADGLVTDPAALRARLTASALRSEPARCQLGLAYAGVDDVRAAMYLPACQALGASDDVRARAITRAAAVERRLIAAGCVRVEVLASHAGLWVTVDGTPADDVRAPATIWMPPGVHRFTAQIGDAMLQNVLDVAPGSPGTVLFEVPAPVAGVPADKAIDFGDADEPVDDGIAGPPPAIEHPSLLPDRYRKGMATAPALPGADAPAPLADDGIEGDVGDNGRPPTLGLTASLGVTHERTGTNIVAGADLDLHLRGRWHLAVRVDGTHVGGQPETMPDAATDVLALRVAGLAGSTIVAAATFELAARAGARASLQLDDDLGGHAIHRVALDLLAGARLSFMRNRLVVLDVVAEQGLTPLVDDRRRLGVLVALGLQLPLS